MLQAVNLSDLAQDRDDEGRDRGGDSQSGRARQSPQQQEQVEKQKASSRALHPAGTGNSSRQLVDQNNSSGDVLDTEAEQSAHSRADLPADRQGTEEHSRGAEAERGAPSGSRELPAGGENPGPVEEAAEHHKSAEEKDDGEGLPDGQDKAADTTPDDPPFASARLAPELAEQNQAFAARLRGVFEQQRARRWAKAAEEAGHQPPGGILGNTGLLIEAHLKIYEVSRR